MKYSYNKLLEINYLTIWCHFFCFCKNQLFRYQFVDGPKSAPRLAVIYCVTLPCPKQTPSEPERGWFFPTRARWLRLLDREQVPSVEREPCSQCLTFIMAVGDVCNTSENGVFIGSLSHFAGHHWPLHHVKQLRLNVLNIHWQKHMTKESEIHSKSGVSATVYSRLVRKDFYISVPPSVIYLFFSFLFFYYLALNIMCFCFPQ